MSVGVPVNPSSSSQLPAAPTTTTRRRMADSQEDHSLVHTVGGGNAVVYVPDEEGTVTSCGGGGGVGGTPCCPSGSHHNYLVGFLSLRKFRLVWMLMVENKSKWTAGIARNMRSSTNLGRLILKLLTILVVTFFLIVALSGGVGRRRRHVEKHEFVVSIHPRPTIEKIIREDESSNSFQVLVPKTKSVCSFSQEQSQQKFLFFS